MQGLLHWDGDRILRLAANRVSMQSPKAPGAPLTFVNSVTVAGDGMVYFTASTHIPPPYVRGTYMTKLAAGLTAMDVRSTCTPAWRLVQFQSSRQTLFV
jgi:hypothetical protein